MSMAFTSLGFLGLVAAAVLLFYILPGGCRPYVLLAASMAFYVIGGGKTVVCVLFTAATVYFAALGLDAYNRKRKTLPKEDRRAFDARALRSRRAIVLAVCLLNFGLLYVLKYWNFTAELIAPLVDRVAKGKSVPTVRLLMPLGVSFFMFQSVGYVVDVYRGKCPAQKNFLKLLLFVSFFPQMVQGPISRYDRLGPQLCHEKPLDCTDLRRGIELMMWGYFKKLVIADRAAVAVNAIMERVWQQTGSVMAFGVLLYCIQLYCDFSGGIDITRGVAQLFGIRLEENFRRPIFARSLTEFWRRWHITLGAWMRDYVFYPLALSGPFAALGKLTRKKIGGKLGKIVPTSLATFIIYFIIGVWHGANFRYIAYGFWNGAIITSSLLLAARYEALKTKLRIDENRGWFRAFQTLRTCLIVFIGRYITRAPRLLTAFWMMKETVLHPGFASLTDGTLLTFGLGLYDYLVIATGTLVLLGAEWYQEKRGDVGEAVEKKSPFVQWLVLFVSLLALLVLGIMRSDGISSEFIYKQF